MKNGVTRKVLVNVDPQVDFTTGILANKNAVRVIPAIRGKVCYALCNGYVVIFTADTHGDDYLETEEGKNLPILHTKEGTEGWKIVPELIKFIDSEYNGILLPGHAYLIRKHTFGSVELGEALRKYDPEIIEFTGIETGICVISNVLIAKAFCPNAHIIVHKKCCACLTEETHQTALEAMRMCQVEII